MKMKIKLAIIYHIFMMFCFVCDTIVNKITCKRTESFIVIKSIF